MKLAKILSVFAVIAAAGMVPAGCDSPAGGGNGYDEVVSAAASGTAFNSAGEEQSGGASGAEKTIKVKFNVKNGGAGLVESTGFVSTQDDSYLAYGWDWFANDFTITITVPENDKYLNIRWKGEDFFWGAIYVKAKMKPESGAITLDYNGKKKVAIKNLYDVLIGAVNEPVAGGKGAALFGEDWKDAFTRWLAQ